MFYQDTNQEKARTEKLQVLTMEIIRRHSQEIRNDSDLQKCTSVICHVLNRSHFVPFKLNRNTPP